MSAAQAETAVVEALRRGAGTQREIARVAKLPIAEVARSVQRLRFKGKIKFDKLELSESMLAAGANPAAGVEAGSEDAPNEGAAAADPPAAAPEPAPARPKRRYGERPNLARIRAEAERDPGEAGSVVDRIEAEAAATTARRRLARSTGTVTSPIPGRRGELPEDLTGIEMIQTVAMKSPADLIKALDRKHPELWARCVALGRALGQRPAEALYRALESGLEIEEEAAA